MKAFWMSVSQAEIFFELCELVKADTKETCEAVLEAMAQEGLIGQIVETPKNHEEYIKHVSEKFGNVLTISKGDLK